MKKQLMSIMAIGIAALFLGAGTFAYFSDTETSTGNTFTAGTLAMDIADSDEGWNDGDPVTASWQSPANWAPGETFTTGTIRLKNVGSIDINYLFTTFYNYAYSSPAGNYDLGNVIEVVEYWEDIPGYQWIQNIGGLQSLELQIGDGESPLTLRELVDAWWEGDTTWVDYCTGSGYDTTPGPAIIVGGTYQTYLKLEFNATAGNEYQGASCSFDIDYEGVQNNTAQKH